ncbi:MAG: glycosyltransferase [Hydrogenophilales bacterium]|nr:glycosyltransferase [Hydrogenophilales bacterium]
MGAVSFSIDLRLVKALKRALPLDVFVETGTFMGDSCETVKNHFQEIFTVELSEQYSQKAQSRFADFPYISVIQGASPEALADLAPMLTGRSVLYFLDAHWCNAQNTAGSTSQCPLLDELRAIGQLNLDSAIVIDDARLFLAPPPAPHEIAQWPTLPEILSALGELGTGHQLMVINDNIVFFPPSARFAVRQYARNHGIDWLHVMQKARELDRLEHAKATYGQPVDFIVRCAQVVLRPRLGRLNHHPPCPLALPASHRSTLEAGQQPSISLITPSFNQGAFIERTLQSVLAQGYPHLEYYVQDGGSTDETVAILRRYEGRLAGWASASDGGQSQAINLGFARTSGEIMAWLNSDDLLLPGALAYVADYFARHPEVEVVYGHRILIDEDDQEIGRWILPSHDDGVLSWADFIPQETLFWRRSLWEKAGGRVDESYRFAMDWDLLLRFRAAGARMVRLPRFLGAFRVHGAQKTSAVIADVGFGEMDRLRQRVLGREVSRTEIGRAIRRYLLAHLYHDWSYRVFGRLT